jgi:S1-C subfamily serine protease
MKYITLFLAFLVATPVFSQDLKNRKRVANFLQDISVTIKSEGKWSKSEGSGVLIVREIEDKEVTFVWTAAHVVDNLRTVRDVIDEGGRPRKVVEFKDAQIVKELVSEGRRVGEIKMDAMVIKYSNADDGHDLALLMVRAKDYSKESARFYLNEEDAIVPIGTSLFHVGSLLGQMGANSMTTGIVSQVGRIHGKQEYDQTTVTAFPGSSGGGVFLTDGRYVGMLVRGAGEGFNLTVPIRRMKRWAKENDVLWAIDPNIEAPSLKNLKKIAVEDSGIKSGGNEGGDGDTEVSAYPFLIKTERKLDIYK